MIRLLESQCQYCYKFRGFCILAYHRILDRGCPPILLHDSFPLITITFSWGSRGFPPGNFSLSSSVNLQNLKTDIHTTFVPFPFCIPPWGCPPILLYHSFTYCHYYSLGGPGGLPLVISLYLLHPLTKPQYRYSHPFFIPFNTDIKRHILSPPW